MNYIIEKTDELVKYLAKKGFITEHYGDYFRIVVENNSITEVKHGDRVFYHNFAEEFEPLEWLNNVEELKQRLGETNTCASALGETNMNKIPYVVINKNETVAKFILDLVKPIYGTSAVTENSLDEVWFINPKGPNITQGSLSFAQNYSKEYEQITLDELVRLYTKPTQIEVKLNEKYSAFVNKNGVTVGCQKFPLSIIDALAEAKNKLKL